MGALDAVAVRVAGGATVRIRPAGSSMVPLIRSRQLVTIAPADPAKLAVGDIVLARVSGTVYLHLVTAIAGGRGANRQQPWPDQRMDQSRKSFRALHRDRRGAA
ncbi:hypothetical protein ACFWF7_05470 [Nocardia sp. NPDC060256]|uniref:hypothetical protein n=1 Tax=unclassified Nocardia TaxID=2637762 RepID=UPI00365345ED